MAGYLSAALLLAAAAVFAQSNVPVPSSASADAYSVNEALLAVGARDLTGVFGFVPESQAPMALADYLMRNHRVLKKFVHKGERDLKNADGISDWDKKVFLYLVGANAQARLPEFVERIAPKLMRRVNGLALAPVVPLEVMLQRRAEKR